MNQQSIENELNNSLCYNADYVPLNKQENA